MDSALDSALDQESVRDSESGLVWASVSASALELVLVLVLALCRASELE